MAEVVFAHVAHVPQAERHDLMMEVLAKEEAAFKGRFFRGKVSSRRGFSDGACSGVETEMALEYGWMRTRACLVGDRFYIRSINGDEDSVRGSIGSRFFEAFRIRR